MWRVTFVLMATAAVAMITPSDSASQAGKEAARDEFRWSGPVGQGKAIEIKTQVGDIRAGPAAGDSVELVAVKTGKKNDPREVRIQVLEHEGGITVCTMYPENPKQKKPNDCQPGQAGHLETPRSDVRADFDVRIPTGVRFAVQYSRGSFTAESLGGEVDVRAAAGDIRFSTSSYGQASVFGGRIIASLGAAKWPKKLTFSSTGGSIEVVLPREVEATIKATSVAGPVVVAKEFPQQRPRPLWLTLAKQDPQYARTNWEGTINGGGSDLEVDAGALIWVHPP